MMAKKTAKMVQTKVTFTHASSLRLDVLQENGRVLMYRNVVLT